MFQYDESFRIFYEFIKIDFHETENFFTLTTDPKNVYCVKNPCYELINIFFPPAHPSLRTVVHSCLLVFEIQPAMNLAHIMMQSSLEHPCSTEFKKMFQLELTFLQ